MEAQTRSLFNPVVFVFAFVTAFCLAGKNFLWRYGIDPLVVTGGNLVLFASSIISFYISVRSLRSTNPQAFVRAMYASFMVKFFLVVIAAFIYIMAVKKNVNKPALGLLAILYIVYTIFETRALTRLLRRKKNA